MFKLSGVYALLLLLLWCGNVSAGLVMVSGTWSYTVDLSNSPPQVFTGSASFSYDDATAPMNGTLDNIPLTTFVQNPATIGSTTFTSANTAGLVEFSGGNLLWTRVYGTPGGSAISTSQDDFEVRFAHTPAFSNGATVSAPIGSGFGTTINIDTDSSPTVSFTHTAVPEPGSWFCVGLFGVGILGRRRRLPALSQQRLTRCSYSN